MSYAPDSSGADNVTGYYLSDANNAVSFGTAPLAVSSPAAGFPVIPAALVALGVLGFAILVVGVRRGRKSRMR